MGDAVQWAVAIVALLSLGVSAASFWLSRGRDEKETAAKADTAHMIATTALAKAEMATAALTDARIEFAREYASTNDLAAAENRITSSMDNMHREFVRLTERLDRIIEGFKKT